MKRLLIIIAGLFSIAYGQRYQTMPAEGYGPIKRMRVDSVLNIPIGDTTRKRNLSDGKDSGQIRWFNGSLYVYNGAYWSVVSGGGSGTTPNLDQVASQGNTTGRGLYVNAEDNGFFVTDPSGNAVASLRGNGAEGRVRMNRLSGGSVELAASRATGSRTVQFPDSSGTVALQEYTVSRIVARGDTLRYFVGGDSTYIANFGVKPNLQGALNNGSTLTDDANINAAGHNFTIDSAGTLNLSSKDPAMVDIANLTLSSTGQSVSLGYSTDTTSAALGIDPFGGVQQSIVNTGSTQFTSSTVLRIDSSIYQINTDYLRLNIPSAQPGYVLTSSDTYGTATWQPASGGSNVGDSLVRALDSLAAHNTRIGANTVAITARAALSGAAFTGAVGIGTTASASAAFEISSTTQGVLLPRMTTTQRDAISSPTTNLIVNNTTTTTIDQYSGSSWYSIAGDVDVFLRAAQAMGSPIKAGPLYHISQLNTGTALTSTRSYFNAVYVDKPITITGAAFYQTTQGNFTGSNYNGIALYSYSGGTVTLIDSTARNENIWKGTSGTWQQAAFAGGSRTLQPGLYYLLFLYSSSAQTTAPVIGNTTAGTGNYLAPLTTNSARFYGGVITSVTSPPTSQACSAWTNITTYYGAFLY